jgi:cytoskeletal protein CcmA (bactofilin family)
MGRFNGTIDARKRIELYPPGRIVGDIHAPTILIESGVVFNGNCSMKARTTASATPPKATESTKNSPNSKETQT